MTGRAQFWQNEPNSIGNGATAAEFGEQTEEVLAEFGFGAEEAAQLKQPEVV
jgi:hypothetical protein